MLAAMEQSCNFLIYMIIIERQDTAYIELMVKLHHADGLKEGETSFKNLYNLHN